MTREDLEQLADRELDAYIAEKAMGWTHIREETFTKYKWVHLMGNPSSPGLCRVAVPPYSTDPTAARAVEDEIERRGERTRERYVMALRKMLWVHPTTPSNRDLWMVARATPKQRAIAAALAVGEGGGE